MVIYELDVSPSLGAYWLYADAIVASTTDVTGSITIPDGTSQIIKSGLVSLSPDGSLTASFTTSTGLTGTFVDGCKIRTYNI